MVVLATGCGDWPWAAPRTAGPPMAYGPPPQTTQVGAPLPPGWAWPVGPRTMAFAPSSRAVIRPVPAAALRAAATVDPLAPVEVAPNVFVGRLRRPLPRMSFATAWAPAELAADPPPEVDLRAMGLDGPMKNQQQAGVCWSFALSTAMENGLRRAGIGSDIAPLHLIADNEFQVLWRDGRGKAKVEEPSWPYDPRKACQLDENSGDDAYCMKSYGVVAGSWRNDPALVAERDRAQRSGKYQNIRMKSLAKPANPRDVATLLASGRTLWVQLDMRVEQWRYDRIQPGGILPDWPPGDGLGHAVALVGYRTMPDGRQFRMHNSWGDDWADGGYAWISERMVRERTLEAFTVELGDAAGNPLPARTQPTPVPAPSGSSTPAPTASSQPPFPWPFPFPFPAPAPTTSGGGPAPGQGAGGCGPGQARDAVFGWCATACAGGQAPTAGLCPPPPAGTTPAPGSPAPAPAQGCVAGQKPDFVTGACQPTCPSGAPRAAGLCWM
jgi:hypothetical protein